MRLIALLRGINLGSRNRIAMPALRDALARAGYEDARTHLQSGNVVVDAGLSPERFAQECTQLIAREFGLEIAVVVRTRAQLAAVVKRNPLGRVACDPKRYQVSFLEAKIGAKVAAELAALAVDGEEFAAIGRELYAWHPNGVARSRLWARLASPRLGVLATARSWATTTALLELAQE